MRKLIALTVAALPVLAFAQSTKSVLEKFMEKMQGLKTVSMSFEYRYENAAEGASDRRKGSLLVMGKMYKLDWGESAIYFNGQLRWTYLKSANEVTISAPNLLEDGIFADPSMLFSFDEKDYRYKLRSERTNKEGKAIVEIDLFPKDKKAAYTAISLQLEKSALLPASIVYSGKNGGNVTVQIHKIDPTVKPTLADFTFDAKKHPDVEIVDMR